jgi:hypothetical protein
VSRFVTIFVLLGLLSAIVFGYAAGFDVAALMILASLFAVGLLAIVVTRKSEQGVGGPARCASCGGLMSPNAPYCKHCGEQVAASGG